MGRLWLAMFIAFVLLYALTSQRGVSWQDSGRFQWRVLENMVGDVDLVLAHPLYIIMAQITKFIPFGQLTWRINAFSGIGAAIAVANLLILGTIVSQRKWIGIATAAIFGVSHAVWWLSTIAEVYTWNVAGLTLELILLFMLVRQPRWQTLALLFLVNGLGWSLHNLALLALPVYVIVTLAMVYQRKLAVWSLIAAISAFMVGASIYVFLIIEKETQTGSLALALKTAFLGEYGSKVFNTSLSWPALRVSAVLSGLSFFGFTWLLALIGFFKYPRYLGNLLAGAIVTITLIQIGFFLRYPVPDQFTFILPTLAMMAIAASAGARMLVEKSELWRRITILAFTISLIAPFALYLFGPILAVNTGLVPKRGRELPFRDEVRYWMVPWKQNENSAERFSIAALEQAAPDGIILFDSTATYPILFTQQEIKSFPDVFVASKLSIALPTYEIDSKTFWEAVGEQPLYAVSPIPEIVPSILLEESEIKPASVLYRVRQTTE